MYVRLAKYLLLFACLMSTDIGFGQIKFKKFSIEKALKSANDKDRIIFIDAYTTWCGPCKWMDKNVFNVKSVGNYFNGHFINVKMDMESDKGMEVAKLFEVSAYPSFLFINQEGELLHKAAGARDVANLLQLAKDAQDNHKQLGLFQKEYPNRKYEPDFLYAYARVLKSANQPESRSIAEDYLETQVDWSTEQNVGFIYDFLGFDLNDIKYVYLLNNKSRFYEVVGKSKVQSKILNIITGNLGPAADLDEIEILAANAFRGERVQALDEFKLDQYLNANDDLAHRQFVDLAIDYYHRYLEIHHIQLNNLAWNIHEITADEEKLIIAKEMAESSISLDAQYFNYDTLAHIEYKLGMYEQSKINALQAVALAKANGDDYKSTQELIWKLRKKLP